MNLIAPPAAGASTAHNLPAPAKLNLFLHIVGRRDDGMHLLQSLFVLIDWCDTLHITRRSDTSTITRRDLGRALPDDDLCLRAARTLQAASGARFGADITIDKQVPWGAGLGGGSSDAATTLIALNRLWGLGWPRTQLAALAATLGADVPFFIGGRAALVEGIGEQLTPVSLPQQNYLVVKPAAPLATADVFRHPAVVRNTVARTAADILPGFLAGGETLRGNDDSSLRNDLEIAAQALCPEVAQAIGILRRRNGTARMSGSGSAVFAPWDEKSGATGSLMATDATDGTWPEGWTVRVCRSLDRHPLDDWLD